MDHHDSSSIITVWYRPLSPGYESGSMPTCSILRATSIHLPTSLVFTRVPWSWSIDPYWAFSEKMLQNLMVHQPLWTQPFHPKHFPGSPAEFPRFVELRSGVNMGFSEGSAQPPEALRQAGHLLAQLRNFFCLEMLWGSSNFKSCKIWSILYKCRIYDNMYIYIHIYSIFIHTYIYTYIYIYIYISTYIYIIHIIHICNITYKYVWVCHWRGQIFFLSTRSICTSESLKTQSMRDPSPPAILDLCHLPPVSLTQEALWFSYLSFRADSNEEVPCSTSLSRSKQYGVAQHPVQSQVLKLPWFNSYQGTLSGPSCE